MKRVVVGFYMSDEMRNAIWRKAKEKYGLSHGAFSKVVEEAIERYLERHEGEVVEGGRRDVEGYYFAHLYLPPELHEKLVEHVLRMPGSPYGRMARVIEKALKEYLDMG